MACTGPIVDKFFTVHYYKHNYNYIQDVLLLYILAYTIVYSLLLTKSHTV